MNRNGRGRGAHRRRLRGCDGQVAGIEVLPFGFLVFIAGMLLVATVWDVIDARLAVSTAAREATRAAAESLTHATAERTAHTRAVEAITALGRSPDRVRVAPLSVEGGFRRCARLTVTVEYRLRPVPLPFLGGLGRLPPVRASHTELVDPFRAGLAGPAEC